MGLGSFLGDIVGAALPGVGNIIGGLFGADKSKDAQINAQKQAIEYQQKMYEEIKANLAPWMDAGKGALSQMQDHVIGRGGFKQSPGYDFRLNEGIKARNRAASANGSLNTMAHQKVLERYGQDYGSNEFNNWADRVSGMSGAGQNAAGTLSNFGFNTGRDIAGTLTGIGRARASGYENMTQIGLDGFDQISRAVAPILKKG